MSSIVTFLFATIQSLLVKISDLENLIDSLSKSKSYNPFSPKYKQYTVDKLPLVRQLEKLDYKQIISDLKRDFGKTLNPVKRRGEFTVNSKIVCPYCSAPHEYIYDNDGGRGQMLCKVCNSSFTVSKVHVLESFLQCPFCGNSLTKVKERKDFIVHKCVSHHCVFYKNSVAALSKSDLEESKLHPYRFKLHYIYREFTTDFFTMNLNSLPGNSVNFRFRKFSPHILGLCLTYVVNCGLSTRMTRQAMLDIHGVTISHAMIARYVRTAAAIVTPFVNDYDYNPTNQLAADETYVKVKGITHYVWFVMDAIKKSIIGYSVSNTRTLEPCMLAMRRAFSHFKEFPGSALKFIVDGYTVYELARQQFERVGMNFKLTKVIGLANEDEVSTEYRWIKQIIERLNRTFKFSYRVTNGYGSLQGADTHVAIFVAYYNFLRPHKYRQSLVLNIIPEVDSLPNMPAKWQKLIELSQLHLLDIQ